ncbi:MAG TPA: MFS transporter [Anaerolineae bacterium]|nr:MFS transporter [Anaerolineae bacterium]
MAIIFATRTVLSTAHRIIYPFLPSIARGLGVSLAAAGVLVTVRMLAGLTAPLFGPSADRRSRRDTMEIALVLFPLAGLLLVAAGSLSAGGLVPGSLAVAAIAFMLFGLSKVLYDPTVHAYLGDTVPYHHRGRAIGIVEFSWSAAWLIGVPIAGVLIERLGWRAPWAVLSVLGLLCLALTRLRLPRGRPPRRQEDGISPGVMLAPTWRRLLRRRRVLVLLLTSLLLTMALEIPFIVYGAWLETSFGLSLSALGVASIVVGLAEAAAELGTTLLTDRLGKRRSVLTGLLGLAAGLVLLPGLAKLGLVGALAGVALVMITFEFAIVSLLPLATELVPEERASLLSLNVTAFSLGRIAGAFIGGGLWQWSGGGIAPNAAAGAACTLLAALLMFRGMVEIEG